ncbi:MAG: 2OG-Fe(II) oxygenase [Planctomycetes bacterium]|nr:2OG-Fe(II) oxygenase [Planctomycetota bacterium]
MPRFHLVKDRFFKEARQLRGVFDERFGDPRSTRADRFVWDYWHVPGQYTHLRTPGWEYFPEELYRRFHESLVLWGRRTLGCWDISPPWLSCYVEGCEQQLHSDVPHGPWAFVFSLTPNKRAFQGGETEILRPEVLDYWRNFAQAPDRERDSFTRRIEPRFNRLVVFDPRFPHGVTPVRGTHDPRLGRLVLHGWFTEPRPFVEGAHEDEVVSAVLDEGLEAAGEVLADLSPLHGVLSVRLKITKQGAVERIQVLANTLVRLEAPGSGESTALRRMTRLLRALSFGPAKGKTEVTLPLLFQ